VFCLTGQFKSQIRTIPAIAKSPAVFRNETQLRPFTKNNGGSSNHLPRPHLRREPLPQIEPGPLPHRPQYRKNQQICSILDL
jgi:hypothetical protein